MAQYNDLIAGLTVGSYGTGNGTLTGFTQLWTGTNESNRSYVVASDGSAPSGKKLTCTISSSSLRTLLGVDAINADATRGTIEVVALVRSNYSPSGAAGLGHGFAFNGAGAQATETANALGLGRNGGGGHILRRQPYTGGSAGTANGGSTITTTTGGSSPVPFWIKINLTPTTYTIVAYANGDLDGSPVGSVSSTHSDTLGVFGLFGFSSGSYMEYLYVSVGTNGETAPRPSAAVPAGTTTVTGVTPTSTTASVAWTYSAADQTGFEYRLNGGSAVSAGTSSPFNISSLTASTNYDVEVRAINANGAGAWSSVFNFDTSAAPALPPQGTVTISGVTPSDVTASVAWSYDDSDQTGFEYRINGGTAASAGTSSPYVVTGLTASTNYDVEIRAINANGSGSWSSPFNFDTTATVTSLTIDTVFDLSNISSVSSTVTNAATSTPTVFLTPRPQTMTPTPNWRNIVGKLVGCTGKQPFIQFNRANQDSPTSPRDSLWRPCWTTDFVTFTQFPSVSTASGSSGYYEVQASSAFTDDVVYVMTNPAYPQSQSDTFAVDLLTTYSTIASATNYAAAAKIANPSWPTGAVYVTNAANDYPTDSGEAMSGVNLGSLAIYGFKLDWGTVHGGTTDGGAKRTAVLTYGQHAQGEAQASISYFGALTWLLSSADAAAILLRRNFIFYIYFDINGSGIKGGHRRLSYGTGSSNTNAAQDLNRIWDQTTPTIPEVRYTRDAILADTAGAAAVLIDWHGTADNIGDYNSIESSVFNTSNSATWNSLAASYFDMTDQVITTVPNSDGYIINWAYSVLGADYATHAEHANRGNNSKSNLESVGQSWLKTLQAADAGGMFYTAGAGFVGDITKLSLTSTPQVLDITQGFNSTFNNNSLVINNQDVLVSGGYLSDILEVSLPLSYNNLTLTTGTSVEFLGEISKSNLTASGKELSVLTGLAIPFAGDIVKTSLTLNAKTLEILHGNVLEIQKLALSIASKNLEMGVTEYPIIPIERVFILKDKTRSYLVKQNVNITIN